VSSYGGVCVPDGNGAKFGTSRLESASLDSEGTDGGGGVGGVGDVRADWSDGGDGVADWSEGEEVTAGRSEGEEGREGGGFCESLSFTMIELFFLASGGVSGVARVGGEAKSDCKLRSRLLEGEGVGWVSSVVGDVTIGTRDCALGEVVLEGSGE
jgi:hypothetical protein